MILMTKSTQVMVLITFFGLVLNKLYDSVKVTWTPGIASMSVPIDLACLSKVFYHVLYLLPLTCFFSCMMRTDLIQDFLIVKVLMTNIAPKKCAGIALNAA